MKARNGMGLAVLAVLVGFSMIGGAIAIVRLSNVVENNNTSELPVVVQLKPTTATPGGDLPNYVAGSVVTGQGYDMQVSWTTTKDLTSAGIVVEFAKTTINASDVVMSWSDGGAWTAIVWTVNAGVLHGTLGIVGSQPSGAVVNYYATLTYTVPGSFNFKVWVEGSL